MALEIPEIEAKRAKLYQPAWVIVDEFNIDDLETSYALEDRVPLGRFSKKFMLRIALAVRSVAQARKAKIVPRR